jgi:polysaccharide pyruvyl transferase WcaK-like protein
MKIHFDFHCRAQVVLVSIKGNLQQGAPMSLHFCVYRWTAPNAGDVVLFEGLKALFPPETCWTEIDIWTRLPDAMALINASDGLILGGGTILGNLKTFVLDPNFVRQLQVPVCLMGTGIRDQGRAFIDEELREPLADLLAICAPAGVRGQLSVDFLQASGLGTRNVSVIGDTALALQWPSQPTRGIGVNIRPRPEGGQETTIEMMQQVLRTDALADFGPVEFFSCHDKWDLAPAAELGVPIVPYDGAEAFLTRLAGYDLVISERLHGAVLAHALGRPAVQLSYERKCHDYMNAMDCGDLCLDTRDPAALIAACTRAQNSARRFGPPLARYRTALQVAANAFLNRL